MSPSKNLQAAPANTLPLDAQMPENTETATFCMGCFWSPDARFGCLPGVVRTRVGYTGGTKLNPTYYSLGDHIETVQVDYDPNQLSYAQLLDIFWLNHDPTRPSVKQQYMSAAFYHSDEQKQLLEETKKRESEKQNSEIYTEIAPIQQFYLAEDYHQKYRLRGDRDLMQEFDRVYTEAQFINSTVAARTNGYLSGYGQLSSLQKEIDEFGFSDTARQKLQKIVASRG
jgi:methionine-S-sulfoxide reductase